jgi:KAP family P-loop domain
MADGHAGSDAVSDVLNGKPEQSQSARGPFEAAGGRASQASVTENNHNNTSRTGFRTFSNQDFSVTPSWRKLEGILAGNGGCYGLFGPRGSGKSWLMLKAIDEAKSKGGFGLWFPSPSEYDSNAFLSAISDNLASEVERKFIRNNRANILLRGARRILYGVAGIPLAIALIVFVVRGFTGFKDSTTSSIIQILPVWLWGVALYGALLLIGTYVIQYFRDSLPSGRLVREAIALRERIRYTASLKYGAEMGISGGKSLAATLKRTQEKDLSERPTTIASLVFDFRNLVGQIAELLHHPVVIGIDELDKIGDPVAVRALLRDIKGIFEITGVHFLVSVSEEAAAALQLGTLQTGGRNEFNSSFYTVIELPPLDPSETMALLQARGYEVSATQANALCVISAGNQREVVRLADAMSDSLTQGGGDTHHRLVTHALEEESFALLHEIIRESGGDASAALASTAKAKAWRALPREGFASLQSFVTLGRSGIEKYWQPSWDDKGWDTVSESWRRLLIRLFVSASMLENGGADSQPSGLLCDEATVVDLRNIMLMASYGADIARLMLSARFGHDFRDKYKQVTMTGPPAVLPATPVPGDVQRRNA